ncbi:hypothetical protein C8039_05225 [Halogeometricum sp. wsp3]|nr:hypothetical protein C8039_05225 [Halogeometricum sp. wsp3]
MRRTSRGPLRQNRVDGLVGDIDDRRAVQPATATELVRLEREGGRDTRPLSAGSTLDQILDVEHLPEQRRDAGL